MSFIKKFFGKSATTFVWGGCFRNVSPCLEETIEASRWSLDSADDNLLMLNPLPLAIGVVKIPIWEVGLGNLEQSQYFPQTVLDLAKLK